MRTTSVTPAGPAHPRSCFGKSYLAADRRHPPILGPPFGSRGAGRKDITNASGGTEPANRRQIKTSTAHFAHFLRHAGQATPQSFAARHRSAGILHRERVADTSDRVGSAAGSKSNDARHGRGLTWHQTGATVIQELCTLTLSGLSPDTASIRQPRQLQTAYTRALVPARHPGRVFPRSQYYPASVRWLVAPQNWVGRSCGV